MTREEKDLVLLHYINEWAHEPKARKDSSREYVWISYKKILTDIGDQLGTTYKRPLIFRLKRLKKEKKLAIKRLGSKKRHLVYFKVLANLLIYTPKRIDNKIIGTDTFKNFVDL